jgi:hypothetical protein
MNVLKLKIESLQDSSKIFPQNIFINNNLYHSSKSIQNELPTNRFAIVHDLNSKEIVKKVHKYPKMAWKNGL